MESDTGLINSIYGGVLVAMAWLARFFFVRAVERIDTIEESVEHIRGHCIESKELDSLEARLSETINRSSEDIKTRIDHTTGRVDDLYKQATK